MRLCEASLPMLRGGAALPGYARRDQAVGIVHLGIGAFHRAHQAVYTDTAMAAGDRDWRILGVSLRSGDVAAQLQPQDGLYTVTTRDGQGDAMRVVGAVAGVRVAPRERAAVVAAIAAASTHVVSLTVTEKGYLRGAGGGLDWDTLAAGPEGGRSSIYGLLRDALAVRRDAGRGGLTLLSCDNLAGNGALLGRLLAEFVARDDPALAAWTARECATPSTMVDRIVPATTAADLDAVEQAIGLRDEAGVVAEPFSQWVVEDRFAGPRPRWEAAGAQIVGDVHAYEAAKLQMLNGAHSALAYLGLPRGHAFVHEAAADPVLRGVIRRLMAEAAASLSPTPAFDPDAYAATLLQRFDNRGLPHRLAQIAADGSQKVPERWLRTLATHQARGEACPALLRALAAWIAFVRDDRFVVNDPQAATLAALWAAGGEEGIVPALFGSGGLFSAWWVAGAEDLPVLRAALRGSS